MENIHDIVLAAINQSSWLDTYDCLYPESDDDNTDCYFQSKQAYELYIDEVSSFFEGLPNEFYVYRSIHADSKEDVDIEYPGEFWTINAETALNFGSHANGNFVMRGWVRKEDIDLEQSIKNYIEFSNLGDSDSEFEITIPNAYDVIHDIEVFTNKEARQMAKGEQFYQPRQSIKQESLKRKIRTLLMEAQNDTVQMRSEITGFHSGQKDIKIEALIDNTVAGYLQYSIYRDEISIQYIEVFPEYRNQGIAYKLFEYLMKEEDVVWDDIYHGSQTNDGYEMYQKLHKRFHDPNFPGKVLRMSFCDSEIRDIVYRLIEVYEEESGISVPANSQWILELENIVRNIRYKGSDDHDDIARFLLNNSDVQNKLKESLLNWEEE